MDVQELDRRIEALEHQEATLNVRLKQLRRQVAETQTDLVEVLADLRSAFRQRQHLREHLITQPGLGERLYSPTDDAPEEPEPAH
jgi:hypothetical protein